MSEMTREELQQHILDVSTGRVRLNLSPDQVDHYIQEQYRKLREESVKHEAV